MSKLFLNRRSGDLQILEQVDGGGTMVTNENSSLDSTIVDDSLFSFGKAYMTKKIILVGAGASGKDMYKSRLEKRGLKSDVSYTTRKIRDNETDNVDYKFISAEEFKVMIDNNQFLQWNEFNGNYYGTHKESIKENDVFIMTPSALEHINEFGRENFHIIYFDIPNVVRTNRLIKRGMNHEEISNRLNEDEETFKNFDNFDKIIEQPTFLSWK